jgi:methionyl-tRNA formyltransferase
MPQKIDKAEARIDWSRPAAEVDRLIRGLSPFPGAWTEVAGERLKLLRSRAARRLRAPGTILRGLTIACGKARSTSPKPSARANARWVLPIF